MLLLEQLVPIWDPEDVAHEVKQLAPVWSSKHRCTPPRDVGREKETDTVERESTREMSRTRVYERYSGWRD